MTTRSPTTNTHSMTSDENPPAYTQVVNPGKDRLANLKMISALRIEYQKIWKSRFLAHSRLSVCLNLLSNTGLLKQAAQMDAEMLEYTMWMVHSNLVATCEGLPNSEVKFHGIDDEFYLRQAYTITDVFDSIENHGVSKADELALASSLLCGLLMTDAYLEEWFHIKACEQLDDYVVRINANQLHTDIMTIQYLTARDFKTPATFNGLAQTSMIGISNLLNTAKYLESRDVS